MKYFIAKNITTFFELDDKIDEIISNQNKILDSLQNLQNIKVENTDNLLDKNITPSNIFNFKNIAYYTVGAALILGIIYYFNSGGDNHDVINEILQKINTNTTVIDQNMKSTLYTIFKNNDHLVDVINNLLIKNHKQINKMLNIHIFNAILKNGRHLEDITKILENTNLTTNTNVGNITASNLKKVIFFDES